jgi:hypothetical protein
MVTASRASADAAAAGTEEPEQTANISMAAQKEKTRFMIYRSFFCKINQNTVSLFI